MVAYHGVGATVERGTSGAAPLKSSLDDQVTLKSRVWSTNGPERPLKSHHKW